MSLIKGKLEHIGRYISPLIQELEEVNDSVISNVGYWAQTVRASCYSSKLPMEGMRVLAGGEKKEDFT